jgi:hypothetical protein
MLNSETYKQRQYHDNFLKKPSKLLVEFLSATPQTIVNRSGGSVYPYKANNKSNLTFATDECK